MNGVRTGDSREPMVALPTVEGGSGASRASGPTIGVVVQVFRRTDFYTEALRSIAAQVGPLPRVEVAVVRSPNLAIEIPSELASRGWRCTVVESKAIGEGPFLADGLTALTTDILLPLDDDDLWVPDKLERVVRSLIEHPRAGYYHNGQAFVDGSGAAIDGAAALRRLRRFTGVPSGPIREVTAEQLRRHPSRLARWGAFFNNSSVGIRRSSLLECLPELRATVRLADSFMFYAALSSGHSLLFDPEPTTKYRIHSGNRSRGSRPPATAPPAELASTRAGRLASIAAMRAMTDRRGERWIHPWLDRDQAYIELLEGFREGEVDRARTVRRVLRLARRWEFVDPLMNAVVALSAAGLAALPGLAHRAYWAGGVGALPPSARSGGR